MTSSNYQIQWDIVGVGGADVASSASYTMRDVIGGLALGDAESSSYQLKSGYRQGIYDQVATFAVYAQDRATQVAATALASTTVTVTSTSDYAVGDEIVLIQDEGEGQIVAVGRVTGVTISTITVGGFAPDGIMPVIDGANDFVYELAGSSISLGTLATTSVSTGVFAWEVTADVQQGYSVYVAEDQDFRTTEGATIADVSDGSITAGSAEYGARSSDSTLSGSTFDSQDTAITTTLTQVGSRGDNSFSNLDFLTLKVAIDGSTVAGSYSHTISVVYVGDY